MRYINTNNLLGSINPLNLPLLLVLENASKEDISMKLSKVIFCDEELNILIEKGYVKEIKGKKSDSFLQKLRLDSKGRKWLDSLSEAGVEEQDKTIFEWLKNIYQKNEKSIGNGKKTQRHIASFRTESGIEKNKLAFLCQEFIDDESEMEYSHKLENVFFRPVNVYDTKFDINESRLYKYYLKKQVYFDSKFLKL